MQSSSNSEFKCKSLPELKYQLINTETEANIILEQIINDKGCVVGIDIEAAVEMSRFGILCLIQIAYNDCAYIFDMLEINPKFTLLKELFTDEKIIKVFHDCSEDCSILFNLYKFDLKSTFDTQIAHRMCYEDIIGCSMNTKHASISLNDLLKEYLGIEHTVKGEMHNMMNNDPYFWKKRPLTDKMLEYTSLDVLFLPKIYELIKENCQGSMYKCLTFDKIFTECQKYLEYCKINLTIKNFNKISIEKDKIVEGLIKNFQKTCIFIQLNIGYNGIITNKRTIHNLMSKHKVGDILNFRIVKLDDSKKRYILDYSEKDTKEIKKENINTNIFTSSNNSSADKETKEQQDIDLTISSFKKKLNINVSSYYPSKMKGQGSITQVSSNTAADSNYPVYLTSSPFQYVHGSCVYAYPYPAGQEVAYGGMTYDYVSYTSKNIPEAKTSTMTFKEDQSIYDIHNSENY